ncbi:shikimate kinase [Candidatus Electrothrix marina]|uniref:Shikimate kinase n=2 Tax=Candidatus Electrothrix marina TaxID=1859130 RepID=A0A444J141_9BACT|nr:shikimate kinase [Candidatus Electrothrix marina]RWX50549.1 shikimate kinase [Candidatus Electrothrix marina]
MSDNIILIGFMGVGKGRTARALAEQTGRFTVDTDDLIESMVNMKIRDIFAAQGEAEFRRLEQKAADWLEYHVSGTVVSTGGGFFNVGNLNRLGKVVYLHATVEGIYHSICNHPNAKKKIKKRPLLADLKQAEKLFRERLPQYRKLADIEIAVTGKTSLERAEEIAGYLGD